MTADARRLALALILTLAASSAFAQATGSAENAGTPPAAAGSATTGLRAPVAVAGAAPGSSPVLPRGYVSFNGAYQVTGTNFSNGWSVPYYLESQSLRSAYSIKPGVLIDAGGGVRVWRNLVLGVAVSRYRRSDPASLEAMVPHPLLYKQPRSFSGAAAGPARTETAVHANVMWVLAAAPKIQVGVFGGPSFFRVNQVLVATVTFAETYPYTSVTLAGTTMQSVAQSRVGLNAGADLTVLLSRHIGVGMLFRGTGVSGTYPVPSISTAPNVSVSPKAGGLQVGAGLRVRF